MTRRGRPPHPDILTPRQWEVLDLLRRGHTDQQIADALDLTLAGAKYHVSEILTKLGVSSREQAAAWQPSEPREPWWRRALALSLAAKVAAAAIVAVAVVAIAVLAFGVARSGGGDTGEAAAHFPDLGFPTPPRSPTLTREQALLETAHLISGDVHSVKVDLTTLAAVERGDFISPDFDPDETVWYVRIRGPQVEALNPGGPAFPTPSPIGCFEAAVFLTDNAYSGEHALLSEVAAVPVSDDDCGLDFTSDVAMVLASNALAAEFRGKHPDAVTTRQMTVKDALDVLHSNGIDAPPPGDTGPNVWLITATGRFFGASPLTPLPETPQPSTAPPCRIAMSIVSRSGIIAAGSAPSNDC